MDRDDNVLKNAPHTIMEARAGRPGGTPPVSRPYELMLRALVIFMFMFMSCALVVR